MRHRSRWCAAAAMVLWIGTAQAEGIALEELKARNAVQLDAAALKALMTGAKIRYMIPAGSTRAWSNDADGSFVALSGRDELPARHGAGHDRDSAPARAAGRCPPPPQSTHRRWCRTWLRASRR